MQPQNPTIETRIAGAADPYIPELLERKERERREQRMGRNRHLGVLFGLAGPVVCLLVDDGLEAGTFNHFTWSAHWLIGIEMLLLAIWLVRSPTTPWIEAAFAGAFIVGVSFATLVGLWLLPLSLVLSLMLIGLLGFVPFATAYVFGRAARDALAIADILDAPARIGALLLGMLMTAGPSLAIERSNRMLLSQVLKELQDPDPGAIDTAVRVLGPVPWFEDDLLIDPWLKEFDPAKSARIAELYRRRCGAEIHAPFSIWD